MRFRFTIRDLLLLITLFAMGIGWWVDHRSLIAKLKPTYDMTQMKHEYDLIEQRILQLRLMEREAKIELDGLRSAQLKPPTTNR